MPRKDEDFDNSEGTEEALLREIRDRHTYAAAAWRESYEEREIDLRYVAGDPWDPKDRKAREEAKRPCISHDELNQYLNHAINNLRQNKRGIKIDPDGGGADENTAELEQDLVRTIEYRSNATSAYVTAYQSALEGSIGFIRVSRRYVEQEDLTAENFDHQEMAVRNVANAGLVLFDPDCKEADWSDGEYCFVLNPISRKEFKRKYPNAQVRDFSSEQIRLAPEWFSGDNVLTAEYWKVITEEKVVYRTDSGAIVDRLPEGAKGDQRVQKTRRIVQYITNGVEILKQTPEPGTILPIVPVIGKEMYVEGKRVLFSLVRLARDPQMTLAYLASQELEEAGLTPKVPYKGYVGQFDTDSDAWDNITKIPRAYVQADPVVDKATNAVLPLPVREQFTPNFQAYEVAKDAARRAIQAAMGTSALPTAAQRDNAKSGKALLEIQSAQDIGSFHFLDNFDRALMLLGRVMDERMEAVYGQPDREMMLTKADDKQRHVRLNTEEPYFDQKLEKQVHYPVGKGRHNITISVGPYKESQRQAVSDFVDTLIANLKSLPIPPPQAAKILAIAVQMKQLGVKGDQLAEIISPEQNGGEVPPEAQQAIQQIGGQLQALHAYAKQLEGQIQKLESEKQAKVVDNEYKVEIEKLRIEADLAKAEITTKSQALEERLTFIEDIWKQLHAQAHEAALQATDHAHAADIAAAQPSAAEEPVAA